MSGNNALYNYAREICATTGLDWVNSDIRCALIDTGAYTYAASHKFLTDVPSAAFIAPTNGTRAGSAIGTSGTRTATDGACDGPDITFSTISGTSAEAVIIFKWVTSASDSWLIAYIDTATGLPITPNGGNIIIQWDSGANKIFRP
jgi:hypothetical protein